MRFLREPDVIAKTGLSSVTLWRMRRRGAFPEPVKLTDDGFAVAWIEAEVDAWMERRIAASRSAPTKQEGEAAAA